MKGRLWLQILVSLTFAAAQPKPQYQSFLGCFQDDDKRDFKQSKKGIAGKAQHDAHGLEKCRAFAKLEKKTYFAMQNEGDCYIGNSFGTEKTYVQIHTEKCIGKKAKTCGNTEHMNYCGGPSANAVYTTKPMGPPAMVRANKWMQINSPWGMWACMGTKNKESDVRMLQCDKRDAGSTANNFLWQFDKKDRLRNKKKKWKGQCVDVHVVNKNLYMHNCHNGNNQKWYWDFGSNLISRWNNLVVDWHTGNNNLYANNWHKGENLMFWWNIGQPLMISGGTKFGRVWLSTTDVGDKVDLWKVNGNRQKWQFIRREKGWYNIMLTGSMIKNRKDLKLGNCYLSATEDGKKIDLFAQDDGSGRQRWTVKKLGDGYYNIMVACTKKDCVKGGRKYLSAGINGDYVDLWKNDDKSGRQRWKLFEDQLTPAPTPRPTPRPTPVPVKNLISGGGWKIVGKKKCTISIENGVKYPCAVSPNYPKTYNREESCTISMSKKTEYVALEGSTEKYFDYLTLAGKEYSGKLKGQKVNVKGSLTAKWTADFWEGTTGWKFCKAQPPRLKVLDKKRKGKKDEKKKKKDEKKMKKDKKKKDKGKKKR